MPFENAVKSAVALAGVDECALCASLGAIRDDTERSWALARAHLAAHAPNVAEFRRRRELAKSACMQANAARLEFENHRSGHI
jgi:hypothetical protein